MSNATLISSKRIYYLDYLRAFIVVQVIVFHSLLPYVIGYDWIINDEAKTLFYTMWCIVLDVFMMPTLFFIAGYFSFPSIRKNSIRSFVVNKITRIAIPFFIGITMLVPIICYIEALTYGTTSSSYTSYWLYEYFSSFIDTKHFWFLSSLFFFYMVFVMIYSMSKEKFKRVYNESSNKSVSPKTMILFLLRFFIIGIVVFFATGLFISDLNWVAFGKFIIFQPTRWTNYILYFIFGIICFVKKVEIPKNLTQKLPLLILASIISILGFLAFKIPFYYENTARIDVQFFNAIIYSFFCFIMFITLLTVFKRYLNKPSKTWGRLAANSYTIYMVHMVYTVLIQYYMVNLSVSIHTKFFGALIGTFILSYITSEIILIVLSIVGIGKNKKTDIAVPPITKM
ncbi:acyltransferase family protein [Clostridium formicaceticum]|uniref:Glucans biosynthesis protein C n=1 Tax=Clostridium formicaceticum TaxID=1497 RepID=A0AAC9RGQ5_9CLOT|nr:acyltransferase family protein [Clostridium formicaceticum]AOY76249.1 hypothetical protein BJL90_10255 [Clostridium formicaceticum]ARE86631.1 Glucans biosynthesis protein C [Clostridium formicaceticum]